MNALVFDIETIPDAELIRTLYQLHDLDDQEVIQAMQTKRRREANGSDFLPLHMHKVVAISAVLQRGDGIKVWSLGDESSDEAELIQRFYDGIDRFLPELVSWNGAGFDLPVLHYRSLKHKIDAARYWEHGDADQAFKFNNYLNRFHWRHLDLMDVLAGFNLRASAKLDEIAVMLGFPGKLGMSGAAVYDCYQQGDIKKIRDYCETDVLNTYLVYVRWLLVSGQLSQSRYKQTLQSLFDWLAAQEFDHFDEFIGVWLETDMDIAQ